MKTSKKQKNKFIESARAAGCSEDEAVFDATLKTIGSHKSGRHMAKELKTAEELKTLLDERISRYRLAHEPNPQWIKIVRADPDKVGANWKVSHGSRTALPGDFSEAIKRVTPELQKLYDLIPEKP